MGWKIGEKVVCVVDTNENLIINDIYEIDYTTSNTDRCFIGLKNVFNYKKEKIYFHPKHFERLHKVRTSKMKKLTK